MVAAALWTAEQRYDIRFTEITGKVPVFHPDVRVFEVTDAPSGAHRGLFYLDNFARGGQAIRRMGSRAIAPSTGSTVAQLPSRRTTTTSSRPRPASRC